MEADAELLYAGRAALHRRGRRNPQRSAQLRRCQATAGGKRLCRSAGHRAGGAGYACSQGLGRSDVGLLKRLGIKAELVALDSSTLFARMRQKSPPSEGGWNTFPSRGKGAASITPAR